MFAAPASNLVTDFQSTLGQHRVTPLAETLLAMQLSFDLEAKEILEICAPKTGNTREKL